MFVHSWKKLRKPSLRITGSVSSVSSVSRAIDSNHSVLSKCIEVIVVFAMIGWPFTEPLNLSPVLYSILQS